MRALALVEQVVAPVDERAHGLLARQRRAIAAGEDAEALVSRSARLWTRHGLDARRGEFDRERDAVETAADIDDDRRIGVGEREAGVGGGGAIDEERNRAELLGGLRRSSGARLGNRERAHAMDHLARDAKPFAAGGEHANLRRSLDDRRRRSAPRLRRGARSCRG